VLPGNRKVAGLKMAVRRISSCLDELHQSLTEAMAQVGATLSQADNRKAIRVSPLSSDLYEHCVHLNGVIGRALEEIGRVLERKKA
jgi:hypothetical protein